MFDHLAVSRFQSMPAGRTGRSWPDVVPEWLDLTVDLAVGVDQLPPGLVRPPLTGPGPPHAPDDGDDTSVDGVRLPEDVGEVPLRTLPAVE